MSWKPPITHIYYEVDTGHFLQYSWNSLHNNHIGQAKLNLSKKRLKISKGWSEAVNLINTDNATAKRTNNYLQKTKDLVTGTHKKPRVNSGALEG